MGKANSEHVNGVVRWKNLIPLIISLVVLGGGAGVYALNANKEYLHPDAVRFREMEPIRIEIKTVRSDIAELRAEVREIRKMLIRFLADRK